MLGASFHGYGSAHSNAANFATIESRFQEANQYATFDIDFGATAGEGRFWGFKHGPNVGEGIWLTKEGLVFCKRNSTLNDGTWYGYIIFG